MPSRILNYEKRLYSIAKDPLNCFHIALGMEKTTNLIDLRYVKTPIFQMGFQDDRDKCVELKFIHSDSSNLDLFDYFRIYIRMGSAERKHNVI